MKDRPDLAQDPDLSADMPVPTSFGAGIFNIGWYIQYIYIAL